MRPRWKLVWLFYGMAFGWVTLVALGLVALGVRDLGIGAAKFAQIALALLYMPAPLVAALIVERIAGDGHLIRYTFQGFGRKLLRLIAFTVLAMGAWFLVDAGATWLFGNVLHVPGVGTLASTSQQLAANLTALLGPKAVSAARVPAPALLIVLGLFAGLAAGFTVNGLFAFGEEYGWRGWLMNELRPLGPVKANLLTGVLWGLWHAPVIFLGFNYGPYRLVGPLFMVVFCTALSFLFSRGRDYTGSLLTSAVMHGALNGSAGFFLLLVGGGTELVRVPVGLLGSAGIFVVAGVAWYATRGRLRDTLDPARSNAELAERANPEGGIAV